MEGKLLSEEYEQTLAKYSTLLNQIRQRMAMQQLDHATYQLLIRELDRTAHDGLAALDVQLQAARGRQDYVLGARVQDSINEWQRKTSDLSKLLHRKSPSR